MRQHFHCLQWYAGSERVKLILWSFEASLILSPNMCLWSNADSLCIEFPGLCTVRRGTTSSGYHGWSRVSSRTRRSSAQTRGTTPRDASCHWLRTSPSTWSCWRMTCSRTASCSSNTANVSPVRKPWIFERTRQSIVFCTVYIFQIGLTGCFTSHSIDSSLMSINNNIPPAFDTDVSFTSRFQCQYWNCVRVDIVYFATLFRCTTQKKFSKYWSIIIVILTTFFHH